MKVTTALAALAAGTGFVAPAVAQAPAQPEAPPAPAKPSNAGLYAGGAINLYFADKDFAASGMPLQFIDQPSPAAIMGRVGYAFNDYFAVEAEAGVGGAASDFSGSGVDGSIRTKSAAGAYLVGTYPLAGQSLYLLGRVGYSTYKLERKLNGSSPPDVESSGPAVGAGAGIRTGSWDFRMDYTFQTGGDGKAGILGMSIQKHF